ncbi:MAG: tRNA (adenosine(37)-N6)-threonylcarbamoyltransferase complex dimerization subunit type 1 TsaB [Paracoccaceae bacterium]
MPPKPLILSFDTSAAHCAAALVSGDQILGAMSEPLQKGQAERLIPMLEEVLADAGKGWADVNLIAVGIGPGNFTGVRIAVSAARGLAFSLGVPAVGVSVFEALAFGTKGVVKVSRDARRGMVFSQGFEDGLPIGEPVMTEGEPVVDVVVDPAKLAFCAAQKSGDVPPAPLYLRSADAALPSDPPPTILP